MRKLLIAVILVGGATPMVLYWLTLGRVPTVLPHEAKQLLVRQDSRAVLVDVRGRQAWRERHIDGAESWPLEEIRRVDGPAAVPQRLKGRKLLLICYIGVHSAEATGHLTGVGVGDVFNVRGGMQEWVSTATAAKGGRFGRYADAAGQITELPFRPAPWYEQFAAVASGFGFKLTYTLLSLIVAVILWRSRAEDLVALRWAMLCFFVGENCCAINYFVFSDTSYLFEYLHSFGMTLCFGFTTYAVIHGMDSRLMMVTDPDKKCAALTLCGRCIKYTDAPCGLKRTFYLLIPACIILALMPLTAHTFDNAYNTFIYGTFYTYSHPVIYQCFEIRYCPLAAVVLLTASLAVLIVKKDNPLPPAKALFSMGMGPLGFAFLRMILARYDRNQVWFVFWEEATELLFIVGVCAVLWIFRTGLFRKPDTMTSPADR